MKHYDESMKWIWDKDTWNGKKDDTNTREYVGDDTFVTKRQMAKNEDTENTE